MLWYDEDQVRILDSRDTLPEEESWWEINMVVENIKEAVRIPDVLGRSKLSEDSEVLGPRLALLSPTLFRFMVDKKKVLALSSS